jgi:hypothetical protein
MAQLCSARISTQVVLRLILSVAIATDAMTPRPTKPPLVVGAAIGVCLVGVFTRSRPVRFSFL